jgi:uncharacterized coiled-coil protein SlyX
MNPLPRRIVGVGMIIAAIVWMLISLFFLVQIWRLRQPVTDWVVTNLDLLYTTCSTTENGLMVIESTVANFSDTTTALETTTIAAAQSLHDTGLLVDTLSTLVGEELPTTITNTQTALSSAQTSAVVIENVLYGLASIPLIGINYSPEVPLSQALGQVSASLDALPGSLEDIQGDLDNTHTDLSLLEENLITINQNIQVINDNLTLAQGVIDDFQVQVRQLKTRLDNSRNSAPDWTRTGALILTIVVLWQGFSQASILVQGIDMLAKRSKLQ